MTTPDADVEQLRRLCSRGTVIFNDDNHGRLQYPLKITACTGTLRANLQQLEIFLRSCFIHGEVPRWTCLETLPGGSRQETHTDYSLAEIREAVKGSIHSNMPYACKSLFLF